MFTLRLKTDFGVPSQVEEILGLAERESKWRDSHDINISVMHLIMDVTVQRGGTSDSLSQNCY